MFYPSVVVEWLWGGTGGIVVCFRHTHTLLKAYYWAVILAH